VSQKSKRVAARSGKAHCEACREQKLLIEHHIHGRDFSDYNKPWNLCWLCASCHDEVHSCPPMIIIEGWASTSEGRKLIWRKAGEEALVNDGAKPPLYSKP